MMNNWQSFIFDFDGVIADSVNVKTIAFAKLFEQYGSEVVEKVVTHHEENGGMSRFEKFQYYYMNYLKETLSDENMKKLSQEFSSLVVDKVVEAPEIMGANDFLSRNYSKIPCFVNSATPIEEVQLIVKRRGLRSYFKEVLGSPKTKEENLDYILRKYKLNPKQCVFFGDAVSDYKAAIAMNVVFYGISKDQFSPLIKFAENVPWGKDFKSVEAFVHQ